MNNRPTAITPGPGGPALPHVTTNQFIRVADAIELHYASCGRQGAPLVVFLHGFPQAWFAWEDMLPIAAETHFCVAPDLRGFNLSSKPTAVKDYRIDRLVGDMVGLVNGLGYEHALFIAHDWGGAVAFSTAIARPDVVERLMILNAPHPVPFARDLANSPAQQRASEYMNELRAPGAETHLLADDCKALLTKFGAMEGGWMTPAMADRHRAAWLEPGAMTAALNYYRASPLYPPFGNDPGAAKLTLDPAEFTVPMPTTVVWGMDDRALLPTLLDGLETVITQLELVRVPAASHWLIHEKPAEVAREIRRFIR